MPTSSTTAAPATPAAVRRRGGRNPWPAYALALPAAAVVIGALGFPLVRQFVMAFQSFGLAQQFGQPPEFVGFRNFTDTLQDSSFWASLARSLVFCVVCASITIVLGVGGGLMLTKVARPIAVAVQMVMLVAWAMPILASMQVFQLLFAPDTGLVGRVLSGLGFHEMRGYNWLSRPLTFFTVAGVVVIWMSVPFVVFMVFAAITQIDESTLEAAEIDGADGWRTFVSVITPAIASVLLIISLLEVIWDLRVFTQIYVLQTNSGIAEQTNVLGTWVYMRGLSGGNFGVASAAALLMLAITVLLTWPYVGRFLKQEDNR